jgi:hypothetical protein
MSTTTAAAKKHRLLFSKWVDASRSQSGTNGGQDLSRDGGGARAEVTGTGCHVANTTTPPYHNGAHTHPHARTRIKVMGMYVFR